MKSKKCVFIGYLPNQKGYKRSTPIKFIIKKKNKLFHKLECDLFREPTWLFINHILKGRSKMKIKSREGFH